MPPENVEIGRASASPMSISRPSSTSRSSISDRVSPYSRPCSRSSSIPVCLGSRATSWRATPMWRRTFSGWVATSKPATVARPSVGARSVHSMRTVVLFPAPFGPEEAVDLAAADVEVDAVDGGLLPEPADQLLGHDGARGTCARGFWARGICARTWICVDAHGSILRRQSGHLLTWFRDFPEPSAGHRSSSGQTDGARRSHRWNRPGGRLPSSA